MPHRDVRASWQQSDQSGRAVLLEDAYAAVGFAEHWFGLELLRTQWNDLPLDVRRAVVIWDKKRRTSVFKWAEGAQYPAMDEMEWEPPAESLVLPPPPTPLQRRYRQVRDFFRDHWVDLTHRFQKS